MINSVQSFCSDTQQRESIRRKGTWKHMDFPKWCAAYVKQGYIS